MIGLLCTCLALSLSSEELEFTRTVVRVTNPETRLALRDVDGDGDEDLLLIDATGIHVRLQAEQGTFSETDDVALAWPSKNVAWMLVDLEGEGRTSLAAYVEGREVRSYRLDGEQRDGRPELAFAGSIPRGRFEMSFYRDVDGDDRLDLVLPAFGSYAIHLRSADGTWAAPLEVQLETEVDYDVGDPRALDASFGQDVSIPWFSLEDVDGDGDVDLVAETEDEVQFHLAEPELSSTPTWRLDLAALRDELPPEGDVDLSNILGELSRTVEWKILDLDGEVPNDLVVQVGTKFRVYRGAARGGPRETIPQVLKSSGNVLTFFLRDVEGSELPDLQILRAQELSLATILRWLLLPGSFDFELFTYRNDGGTFSRRPTRRNLLELEIPRLLAFMKEIEELEEELDSVESVPARRAALGDDDEDNDILDLDGDQLLIFHNRAPEAEEDSLAAIDDVEEALEVFMLRDLDALEDGQKKTFNLRELMEMDFSPGATLRTACAGVDPDQRVALAPAGLAEASIHTRDLDRDGRLDVIVVGKDEDGAWVVNFLIRSSDRSQR